MNVIIIGRRRQGKSTLALYLALRSGCGSGPTIIFDPNAQYRFRTVLLHNMAQLEEWMDRPTRLAIYRPQAGQIEAEFTCLAELLWPWGNYCLILDEAACLQRPNQLHPALERLVRQAPRDGSRNQAGQLTDVALIQSTHRLVDIHSLCRALASDTFLFQTTLSRDLDLIEDQFGAEVRVAVQTLGNHQLIHCWCDDTGMARWSLWDDPSQWYVSTEHGDPTQPRSRRSRPGLESSPGAPSPGSGAPSPGPGAPGPGPGPGPGCGSGTGAPGPGLGSGSGPA